MTTATQPMPGDAVRLTGPFMGEQAGTIGIITGHIGRYVDEASIIFNFSAFRGPNHGELYPCDPCECSQSVSVSGGPGTIGTLMDYLKPTDETAIVAAARETGAIVTAEEHYIHGGLGSIVAQVVGRSHPVPLEMVALQGYAVSGKAEELMVRCGLSPEHVRAAAEAALRRKPA